MLVGDPNSEHAYQPAAIGTFKNVSINWLVECDKNGQSVPKEQSSDTPPYAAASISITFEPYAAMQDSSDKGSDTSSSDNTGGSTVKTNITVLVKNPTSCNPYANALSKSDVTSANSDDETGGTDSAGTTSQDTQSDDSTADGSKASSGNGTSDNTSDGTSSDGTASDSQNN